MASGRPPSGGAGGPGRGGAAPGACPSCGAPAREGQLVCTNCGARIALAYGAKPDWRGPAAIIGAVALLAGGAAGWAIASIGNDATEEASKAIPTQPVETTTPGLAEYGKTQTEPDRPRAPRLARWPEGASAYTVVLAETADRGEARAKAEQAIALGAPAGLLDSDDYTSLEPGSWVAFSGRFPAKEGADAELARLKGLGLRGGTIRFVGTAEEEEQRRRQDQAKRQARTQPDPPATTPTPEEETGRERTETQTDTGRSRTQTTPETDLR